MQDITRRRFIEDSMLAAATVAAASLAPTPLLAQEKNAGASNRIRIGVIGCRIRGKVHAREFAKLSGCEVAYVCDPDRDLAAALAAETGKQQASAPQAVQDLRHVLEDKSIDAISIAAPNHWHALAAIWAMQAGKDVYVEKPVSHNVAEGRRIVQVARKTGRICQTGTQYRSSGPNAAAVAYMRAGKLGEVKLARSIVYGGRASIGGPGTYEIPANVDYDLWAGPAPKTPLKRPQFHYDWHWFWATGNGELGNNNIHSVDLCRWGLGVSGPSHAVISYGGRLGYIDAGETPNTQVVIHDFGAKTIVMETRGLKTDPFHPEYNGGAIFYGTEGIIAKSSLFDLKGKLVEPFKGETGNHFANFLEAVRSRKREDLNADILEGHESTALCHYGNISYRLGAPASSAEIRAALGKLKVHEDTLETFARTEKHLVANGVDLAKTPLVLGPLLQLERGREKFAGNAAANALLGREYRKPYVVPSEKEVLGAQSS